MRSFRIVLLTLSALTLSSCFKAVISSVGDTQASVVKSTQMLSTTKSVTQVVANAKDTLNISAGSGAIAGASISFPPGSLAIAADIIMEQGADLADTSLTSEIALADDVQITQAGSGVIIRPSEPTALNKPMQLSLPLPTLSALRLDKINYAVYYKYLDPSLNQLFTGLKVVDGTAVKFVYDEVAKKDLIQLDGYFGSYWVVVLSREITKAEVAAPKLSEQPIINKANTPVFAISGVVSEKSVVLTQAKPELVWTKPSLLVDSVLRTGVLKASLNGVVKACKMDIFESATDVMGISREVSDIAAAPFPILKTTAHRLMGRFKCMDSEGRLSLSPWSDPATVDAVKLESVVQSPLPPPAGVQAPAPVQMPAPAPAPIPAPAPSQAAAPTATSIAINNSDAYSNASMASVQLTATGANEYYLTSVVGCGGGGTWTAFASPGTTSFNLGQSNSVATLYAKFRLNGGLESSCVSDSIIHDDIAPASPSIQINGGAASTTSTNVTLSLSAADTSPIQIYVTNTVGCGGGGTWENYSGTKSWTLGQADSMALVYVKFRDSALNTTSCISDSIMHNSAVAPTGTGISIAGGAASTQVPDISLNLSATNATEMYITNAPGCQSGGNWQTYSATSPWTLARGQSTTASVYAKFRSASLTESACISDSIDVLPNNLLTNGDFELGNLTSWSQNIAGKFIVTSSSPFSGSFAIQSSAVANSSEACFTQTLTGLNSAIPYELKYAWKYGTEAGYDFARVYVDSVVKEDESGLSNGWQAKSIVLPAGPSSHIVKWCHFKDGSGLANGDFLAVDAIALVPLALLPPASVDAVGSNQAIALTLTANSSSASGYMIVRGLSQITFAPVNGMNYSPGNTYGSDTVIYRSSGLTYTDAGRTNKNVVYYAIYAYDSAYHYSAPVLVQEAATNIFAPSQVDMTSTSSQITLNLTAAAGSAGTGFIIVRNLSSPVTFIPTNGTVHTVGAVSGGQVVYRGSATQFVDTGLTSNAIYHYKIWSYDATNYFSNKAAVREKRAFSCSGVMIGGSCWSFATAMNQSCTAYCNSVNLSFDAGSMEREIYTPGTSANSCRQVTILLGRSSPTANALNTASAKGCYHTGGSNSSYAGNASGANDGSLIEASSFQACPCM